jgi:hypothetical protein
LAKAEGGRRDQIKAQVLRLRTNGFNIAAGSRSYGDVVRSCSSEFPGQTKEMLGVIMNHREEFENRASRQLQDELIIYVFYFESNPRYVIKIVTIL